MIRSARTRSAPSPGRIEVNLIDLYGKLGFDYPRGEAGEKQRAGTGSKAAAKRDHIA